jgi:hypothetical protein
MSGAGVQVLQEIPCLTRPPTKSPGRSESDRTAGSDTADLTDVDTFEDAVQVAAEAPDTHFAAGVRRRWTVYDSRHATP